MKEKSSESSHITAAGREGPPTSQILAEIIAAAPQDRRVTAGWLVEHLQGRAFGILLVVLGALTIIPGIATLSALLLIPPAVQLISGRTAPGMPARIRALSVPSRWLRGEMAETLVHWLARLEGIVVPRFSLVSRPPFTNGIGLIVLGLALVALCPIPLFHILPALAVTVIAVGLLEEDGIALMMGIVLGAGALFAGYEVWRLVILTIAGIGGG